MSHIVKGKVNIVYKDQELLIKALNGLGQLTTNETLYRVGEGFTSEKYPLVLVGEKNNQRIGYKENNGVWEQYQENYGSYGKWTKEISTKIQDRYIAYHYEKQLVDEGYSVSIKEFHDGTLELEAEEMAW